MTDDAACPACGAGVPEGARFCEACGHDLAQPRPMDRDAAGPAGPPDAGVSMEPPLVCASCGRTAFSADGYCDNCGVRRPAAAPHSEIDFRTVAGVSDIGLRHQHNEDAMGVLVFPGGPAAGIVCDGVSSSNRPDTASTAAVAEAVRAFASGLTGVAGGAVTGDEEVTDSAEAAMRAGGRAAQAAAAMAAGTSPGPNPPSSTFVAAIVTAHAVTIGWTGDSRAYWLPDCPDPIAPEPVLAPDEGSIGLPDNTAGSVTTLAGPITGAVPARLTIDDTLAGQLGAAGVMLAPDAPNAAALIRWLGADSTDTDPHVFTFTPNRPGRVLVCSDGLYRYAPTAAEMADVTPAGTPHEVASALVAYALERGGGDNVSVVVLPYPPT